MLWCRVSTLVVVLEREDCFCIFVLTPVCAVGVARRDAIDARNRLLDADFEARARRNAELLQLCGPADVVGPLRAPGIGAKRVDLTGEHIAFHNAVADITRTHTHTHTHTH